MGKAHSLNSSDPESNAFSAGSGGSGGDPATKNKSSYDKAISLVNSAKN